jgi:hypothetical protein
LAELDPEVEGHPSIEPALEGGETTYRGHDGARKAWDEDFLSHAEALEAAGLRE